MRTFLLTLSDESDPRSPRHEVVAGPTHDYDCVRAAFHAKNSDPAFTVVSLWDSTGGVVRRKRLTREVPAPKPRKAPAA